MTLLRTAGIALAVGWLPLLLYIPYDFLRGGGGNPIGLGLLTIAGTAVAAVLLAAHFVARVSRRTTGRPE